MRRIYEVEFKNNKCSIDERIKRNKIYAIRSRFLTAPLFRNLWEVTPLFRNLWEVNLGNPIDLADIIDGSIVGIVFVLRDDEYFLIHRKFNPYV